MTQGDVQTRQRIGIFGGTFDPVHHGHLRSALELRERLALDRLLLMPCHTPSHRTVPVATPAQRLAMLALALEGCDGLVADDHEVRRGGISYSIDTLRELRAQLGAEPALCLVVGADAYCGFSGWKDWQAIAEHAHVVVLHRPGAPLALPAELETWTRTRAIAEDTLGARAAGGVLIVEQTQLAISSSQVRALCASGASPRFLLPERVLDYLQQHRIYAAAAAPPRRSP